jgi:hypothetical protein
MIQELKDTPNTIVAFRASNDMTREDFDSVVLPAVAELVGRTDQLNYLLVVDTPLRNFTFGDWMKDAMLGLNNLQKWNRAAIVSESEGTRYFTGLFSIIMSGEFKGFSHAELQTAIRWVSGSTYENGVHKQVFQQQGGTKD